MRGRTVVSVINDLNQNILNNGSPNLVSYGTESCIDLTIVSLLQWLLYYIFKLEPFAASVSYS